MGRGLAPAATDLIAEQAADHRAADGSGGGVAALHRILDDRLDRAVTRRGLGNLERRRCFATGQQQRKARTQYSGKVLPSTWSFSFSPVQIDGFFSWESN